MKRKTDVGNQVLLYGLPSLLTDILLLTLEKLKNRMSSTLPVIKPMEFAELLPTAMADPPTLDVQRSSPKGPKCG
jgi:hypothetical protein